MRLSIRPRYVFCHTRAFHANIECGQRHANRGNNSKRNFLDALIPQQIPPYSSYYKWLASIRRAQICSGPPKHPRFSPPRRTPHASPQSRIRRHRVSTRHFGTDMARFAADSRFVSPSASRPTHVARRFWPTIGLFEMEASWFVTKP